MLFFTILITIILAGAEVDLFIPGFPDLIKTFNLSPASVQLTLSVNFLSYCVSSLFVGTMGDKYGRRPVILWGLVIFIAGSILCVYAPIFSVLILGRLLQGIGMAAPAVLGYVVVADETPIEKQAGLLGTLNGIITFAMAFAPVIGSYINIAFGWRGNFIVLLVLGVVSLSLCWVFIPNTYKPTLNISLSLKTYIPLLQNKEFIILFAIICGLVACYWVFIGIAPILYMQDMGVKIEHFGFYQGAIAGAFSIMSMLSPIILNRFPHNLCLSFGTNALMCLAIIMLITSIFATDTPIIISIIMTFYVIPFVFPINILYPKSLEIVPHSKAKAAALINFGRLALSAIGLNIVSFVYTGYFMPIALFIFVLTSATFVLTKRYTPKTDNKRIQHVSPEIL